MPPVALPAVLVLPAALPPDHVPPLRAAVLPVGAADLSPARSDATPQAWSTRPETIQQGEMRAELIPPSTMADAAQYSNPDRGATCRA
jgi:hypothetical protein